MANTNKKLVDVPFFELMNQARTATQAVSCTTSSEDGADQFIYYLVGSTFFRYDTFADTWQALAAPVVAPATLATMKYTKRRGYHGRVISAAAGTVRIPGLRGPTLNGQQIEILLGTGAGQKRTITYTGETIHDTGMITGTAANTLVDSLKKWIPNQWAGYTVGITFGTNATQYKQILYNDTNTLYISDANLMPQNPWSNQAFVASAPYALPVTTAGAQAHFVIMSSDYTVNTNWTTVPDRTSQFTTDSGGIYLVSSAAAAPFFTLQYYDVLSDSWTQKTTNQGLFGAALGTDASIERTGKLLATASYVSVGAVSATTRTVTDAGATYAVDALRHHRLVITGGTGMGQNRRIVSNTTTQMQVNRAWDITPDATSTFEVWPNYSRLWLSGGGNSGLLGYNMENDVWMQGHHFDDGVCANISAEIVGGPGGWTNFGVTSGSRIAAGVTAVNATPTAGGTGYSLGDILTCSVGGVGAQVVVTALSSAGVVGSIALINSGTTTGFAVGTGRATTGGTGTGCTIEITSVGVTANIVLASAAWFVTGDVIRFKGCTEGAWNANHTIIGVSSVTTSACTFSVVTPATANMVATASQSATVLVDASKNWVVNEHVGRILHLNVAGLAGTSQVRWILSNTANTITTTSITGGTNGTSKYQIYDTNIFGCDDQRKETDKVGYGHASSGSTTTLVDSTKNWIPGAWVGYLFKVEAGTGYGTGRITITANTATTLTYSVQGFTPDATTRYEIADGWGLATAGAASTLTETGTKNWAVNQWAGKRVRFLAGTLGGTESAVTSNTANALTLTGTPDTTTVYAMTAVPARGSGHAFVWSWNTTNAALRDKVYSFRGSNTNQIDIYDISTDRWQFGNHFAGQSELMNTGSSFSYDGHDGIYFARSVANLPITIYKLDLLNNKVTGVATTTWLQGTVHVGNFMEIVESPVDKYPYLYILQNTGTLLSRAMLF
jgi:hypothetical protein